MCGITGFHSFSLKSKTDIEKIIAPMTTCLNHRGPDRTNFTILDNGFAIIGSTNNFGNGNKNSSDVWLIKANSNGFTTNFVF